MIKQNTFIDYDILKELYENDCDCDYKELLNRVYDLVNYETCIIDWDAFIDIITDSTCIANCKELNINYSNTYKKYFLEAFEKNINIYDLMQVQNIKELKENVLYNFNETEQNAIIDDLKFLLDDTDFIDLLTLIDNIELYNYPTANIYCNRNYKIKYFNFEQEQEKMQDFDILVNNINNFDKFNIDFTNILDNFIDYANNILKKSNIENIEFHITKRTEEDIYKQIIINNNYYDVDVLCNDCTSIENKKDFIYLYDVIMSFNDDTLLNLILFYYALYNNDVEKIDSDIDVNSFNKELKEYYKKCNSVQESDMQENNKNDSEIIDKLLNLINDLSPEVKEKIKNNIN